MMQLLNNGGSGPGSSLLNSNLVDHFLIISLFATYVSEKNTNFILVFKITHFLSESELEPHRSTAASFKEICCKN
jgi:hypothetical protein